MHKDPAQWLRSLSGERIHRGDALELYAIDRALIAGARSRGWSAGMAFALSIDERELYVSLPRATVTGAAHRFAV